MRNPYEAAWIMYASAGPDDRRPLAHFGPLGFAMQDKTATRVLEIRVDIVDDPQISDYWAWLDVGASQPCCIADSEQEMTRRFLLEQPGAPGPAEEQALGLGEVVRLRVTVLGEAATRRERGSWRTPPGGISSAM